MKNTCCNQNKHSDPHHEQESSCEAAPIAPSPVEEVDLLKNQVEQYRDQALRTAADLENYRKRMTREKEEIVRYANSSLLEKLLPILDNFELGLEAARASAAEKAGEIVQGFAMVQRQLSDFLKENGIHAVDAEGVAFDPTVHEAIGQESHESLPEGHVIKQLRRGYRLAERLLRPASVIVSKGKEHGQA
ncbi:MAG: nucleotide exchange factor GrpE [Chthoniobacterales bacterium]|nr:nucleotide exchange factor GrpE [Chthoniobacterales bacterium]